MQIIANGIVGGLAVGTLGLAFLLVYAPARVFHIALAAVFALVPYITWSCLHAGLGWLIALTMGLLSGVGLSLLCEVVNHAPLMRKQASPAAHLISSLGLYIVTVQVIAMIWGNEIKSLRIGADATFTVGAVVVTRGQALTAIISVCILAGFYAWLQMSRLGLRLRALGENPSECALRGLNVKRLRLFVFAMSGLLCSISALLVAYDVGFDPHGSLIAVLLAIVAVILGSKESWWGAVVGGLVLGLTRACVVWVLSARWQDAVTFVMLTVCLLFFPRGVLGRKIRFEAEA